MTTPRGVLLICAVAIIGTVLASRFDSGGSAAFTVRSCDDPRPGVHVHHGVAAMISVHAHALLDRNRLSDVAVMPLEDAAWIIRCDRGPRADSRRRRAIAELLAHGEVGQRFEAALAQLGVEQLEIDEILEFLDDDQGIADPTGVDPALLEMILVNGLRDLMPRLVDPWDDDQPATCTWTQEAPHVVIPPGKGEGIDANNNYIILETTVKIGLGMGRAIHNVDPQSWGVCSPMWTETTLSRWEGGEPVDWTSDHVPPPPLPGKMHTDPSLLFEHFVCECCNCMEAEECPLGCSNSSFELLLCVTTECEPENCENAETFTATYDLPQGRVGECESTGEGSMEDVTWCPETHPWWFCSGTASTVKTRPLKDQGTVTVTPLGGPEDGVLVASVKRILFDESGPNTALLNGLILLNELESMEISRQLGELACCEQ